MNRSHVLILAGCGLAAWSVTAMAAAQHGCDTHGCTSYYIGPRPIRARLTLITGYAAAILAGTGAAMLATRQETVSGLARVLIAKPISA